MPIVIKTPRQIEHIRHAARVAVEVVSAMQQVVRAGITTREIDNVGGDAMRRLGAHSVIKGYPTFEPGTGFPGYSCISVNDEVVHGVPGDRVIKDGDIVKLDVSLSLDNYFASYAITVPVGAIAEPARRVAQVAQRATLLGIERTRPTAKWSEIAKAIQSLIESSGCNVVREFVGFGTGLKTHEDPKVRHFFDSETVRGDFRVRPGMVFTIEPIVLGGSRAIQLLDDNWTIVTNDGAPGATFRHMLAITDDGVRVLTSDA